MYETRLALRLRITGLHFITIGALIGSWFTGCGTHGFPSRARAAGVSSVRRVRYAVSKCCGQVYTGRALDCEKQFPFMASGECRWCVFFENTSSCFGPVPATGAVRACMMQRLGCCLGSPVYNYSIRSFAVDQIPAKHSVWCGAGAEGTVIA